MPRPNKLKVNKDGNKTKKTVTTVNLTCGMCGILKKSSEFYQSYNPLHKTGKLPYCKTCLKEMCFDTNNKMDVHRVKQMLQSVDKPFLYDELQTCISNDSDTIGSYFRMIGSLTQYRDLTYKDSIMQPQIEIDLNCDIDFEPNKDKLAFKVTDDMILKWGVGYEVEEYSAFERKYHLLKNNYPEKTSMHTEALLKYIRYSVKEEISTAKNNVGEAKSWGALAKDAATAAKINPSQLSAADLQDGLSTFGQLARAVEQAQDIIPILPYFKEKPQDKVDFTLWCYINYIRDIKGLPPCEYKDIYNFYEEKKKEYESREYDVAESENDLENESDGDV